MITRFIPRFLLEALIFTTGASSAVHVVLERGLGVNGAALLAWFVGLNVLAVGFAAASAWHRTKHNLGAEEDAGSSDDARRPRLRPTERVEPQGKSRRIGLTLCFWASVLCLSIALVAIVGAGTPRVETNLIWLGTIGGWWIVRGCHGLALVGTRRAIPPRWAAEAELVCATLVIVAVIVFDPFSRTGARATLTTVGLVWAGAAIYALWTDRASSEGLARR